uniref:Fe2OG dioxygenase domain-containing protein n=1 Tax=Bionectria ochroleuca TaxID=29856 RepID=A0A8H7K9R2_BIOOC
MPIPTISFAPIFGKGDVSRARVVAQVRDACLKYGFFQLVDHGVPQDLFDEMIKQSASFFSLPEDVKERYSKEQDKFQRGYERLRAQNFEKRTAGDLKEGYYFGADLPLDHPRVVAGKFNMGPNKYPKEVTDPVKFKETMDTYYSTMLSLSKTLLQVLCETMEISNEWMSEFLDIPIATLRLLHYPPQAPDASEFERGIGQHTDFGAVTILLQDGIGGLQVWDRDASAWIDATPQRGALVINLGNLMMRWTNDRYLSNLHRVINKSGKQRYSVPFFLAGNPDFLVKCFPKCADEIKGPKYPPVTVQRWMEGRYADTYNTSQDKALGELSQSEAKAGMA